MSLLGNIYRKENQEDFSVIPVCVNISRERMINLSIFKFFKNRQKPVSFTTKMFKHIV
jgi:hypothetical protein